MSMKPAILFIAFVACPGAQLNNPNGVVTGVSLPSVCVPSQSGANLYYLTTGAVGLYQCLTTNTWTAVPTSTSGYTGCTANGSNGITCTGAMTASQYNMTAGSPFEVEGAPEAATAVPAPASGNLTLFYNSSNSNHLSTKDSSAAVVDLQGGGTSKYADVFDGSTTTLADGTTVTWSCAAGVCTASWTVPAGVRWLHVVAWSGGGGGGGSTASDRGGSGGGGGGYFDGLCAVTPNSSYTVTVGQGGAASADGYTAAGAGGNSAFGSCFMINGGVGGTTAPSPFGGYIGASPLFGWVHGSGLTVTSTTDCSIDTNGESGTGGNALRGDGGGCGGTRNTGAGTAGAPGGHAIGGAGGGGSSGNNSATGGAAGTSAYGGAGGAGGGWTAGGGLVACGAGNVPGGGGGAAGVTVAAGNQTGCAGARGEVRIYY